MQAEFGIVDAWPVFCEEFKQWVLEDKFTAGRPALEKVGVTFVPLALKHVLSLPDAVVAGILFYAACYFVVSGAELALSRMLSPRRALVIGLSVGAGILLQSVPALTSRFTGTSVEHVLAPMTFATIVAIVLNLVMRIGIRQQEKMTFAGPETGANADEILATLGPDALARLGERYLEQTRVQRKTSAPYFIDKMPNNWAHLGLIHLILPNAKVIDARRHPMSCCFSAYKQHFARGQRYSYDLDDLGRYYRDYLELMAHFDHLLPGRVHRVIYERMVEDTEAEVRRLLDYCGLPFEDDCLRFYENDRAVRTASSEQVRQPIYRDALDQWTNYRPWLEPLQRALGDAVDRYADGVARPQRG